MSAAEPQTNGVAGPSSSAGTNSQTLVGASTQATAATAGSQSAAGQSQSQPGPSSQTPAPGSQQQNPQQNPQQQQQPSSAPRPRDARTLELLLTAQGVTSYEQRVPLLLLDFAYRHTSSVLSDALHLGADPYVTHAGSKPSASSGAAASAPGADASVSASAVQLAIASRLSYQFRGGGGGGGTSKDWLMDVARERNKVALPRVAATEWGVRLPGERFVLNGLSWGLRDEWAPGEDWSAGEDDDEAMADAMEGVEGTVEEEDIGGDGVEGGTQADVFGDTMEEDADMME